MTFEPNRITLDWNLVYNPDHFTDPAGTVANVYDRKEKTLRPDKLDNNLLGMSCQSDGNVSIAKLRDTNKIFKGAITKLVSTQ